MPLLGPGRISAGFRCRQGPAEHAGRRHFANLPYATFSLSFVGPGESLRSICTFMQKEEPPFSRSEPGVSGERPLVRSTGNGEPEARS